MLNLARPRADLPPMAPEALAIRWLSGLAGCAALAMVMWLDVRVALSVVDRARDAGLTGGENGQDVRNWCWVAAALCGLVFAATLYRVLSRSRRPNLALLWLAALAAVMFSLVGFAGSASLFQ